MQWSDDDPVLPYGSDQPTMGHSGSDTSRERAVRDAESGTARARQVRTLGLLDRAGDRGLTWIDLAVMTGWHHGQASGALSAMHKGGRIARLSERRDRCKVYVDLAHVAGRAVEPHGQTNRTALLMEAMNLLTERGFCEHHPLLFPDLEGCWGCRAVDLATRIHLLSKEKS